MVFVLTMAIRQLFQLVVNKIYLWLIASASVSKMVLNEGNLLPINFSEQQQFWRNMFVLERGSRTKYCQHLVRTGKKVYAGFHMAYTKLGQNAKHKLEGFPGQNFEVSG